MAGVLELLLRFERPVLWPAFRPSWERVFPAEASRASSIPPTSLSSYSQASCISERLILTQPLAQGPRRALPPRSSIHACAHAFIHAGLRSFSRLTSGAAQAWTDWRKKASLSEQMKAPLNRQPPTSPQQEAHTLKRQSPTLLHSARMRAAQGPDPSSLNCWISTLSPASHISLCDESYKGLFYCLKREGKKNGN